MVVVDWGSVREDIEPGSEIRAIYTSQAPKVMYK